MPRSKKSTGKLKNKHLSFLMLILLGIGLVAAFFLAQREQDIRQSAQAATQPKDTPLSQRLIVPGYNIYSPSVIYDKDLGIWKMWFGGWLANEQEKKKDRIYYTWSTDKLNWKQPNEVFEHPDGHVLANDPAVIKHSPTVYVMFYTAGIQSLKPNVFNFIYKALSRDGVHWGSVTPLIGLDNGATKGGGWAPSVLVHDNKYYIYYHEMSTHGKTVVLSIFDFNFNRLSSQRVTTDGKYRVNVEVAKVGDKWYMFYDANRPDGAFQIERIESNDGINWDTENVTSVVIPPPIPPGGRNISALTSNVLFDPTNPEKYTLFFGYGGALEARNNSIHMWEMQLAAPVVVPSGSPTVSETPVSLSPTQPQTTPAAVTAKLRFSSGSINVSIKQGEKRHVVNLVSTGGTSFHLRNKPVNTGQNINWQPRSGAIASNTAKPLTIAVGAGVNPGTYRGTASVIDTSAPGSSPVSIPVTVRVLKK